MRILEPVVQIVSFFLEGPGSVPGFLHHASTKMGPSFEIEGLMEIAAINPKIWIL
jgi:hypothetical protein